MSESIATPPGDEQLSGRLADQKDQRSGMLGSAGRTAVKLLRQTRTRAKLGSLHLPITLHGFRQQTILLPVPVAAGPARPAPAVEPDAPVEPLAQTRALRGRLGATERRVARLRHALERERQARALAGAALRDPQALIDQLAADLAALPQRDEAAVRETIGAVLAAYGFQVAQPPSDEKQSDSSETAPVIPGWDRASLEALADRLLADHPEIGNRRYLHLGLEALARQGTITAAQLAASAGMTSPMARHRLRLTLEALCAAGLARQDGPRFVLLTPAQGPAKESRQTGER
jgi:hypothetical protein